MANIIEQVNVDGTTYDIASTAYAICLTSATEATKIISSPYLIGLASTIGVTIHVKFNNGNSALNPTLTISNGDAVLNNAISISGIDTWEAGAIITFTYDGTNWVRDYVGTIASNTITGSGTNGSLVKFNGVNTITDGPALTNPISTQTQETKFLREDGTWQAPTYTIDEKVKQIGITTSGNYPILFKHAASTSDETDTINFGNTSNKLVTINPNTGAIVAPGGLTGNASTATKFSSARSIALSGDVSGSASSDGESGWSITTAIGEGKVTNAMLAGSIANGKLSNSKVTIAGQDVNLGGSIDAATLRTKLGLTQALRFVGSTSTTMSDGYTGTPEGISIYTGTGAIAPTVGDVVLDSSSNAEYVCISVSETTYTWELLGRDSSWALDDEVIKKTGNKGDIIYWSDTNTPVHLVAGTNGYFLKLDNGVPTWAVDNDTKVAQNYSKATTNRPLLFSSAAGTTSESSRGAITASVNNAIYVVPGTGELHATKFYGDGSELTNLSWANITNKTLALYVNTTAAGINNDTAATTNDNTYIHLYDGSIYSTIKLIGAGGTSISSSENSKNITITSKKYKSTGSADALTSLTLTYNNGSAQTNSVSSTAIAIGSVESAILYIKSIEYGTTSVSTGVSEDNT